MDGSQPKNNKVKLSTLIINIIKCRKTWLQMKKRKKTFYGREKSISNIFSRGVTTLEDFSLYLKYLFIPLYQNNRSHSARQKI